MSEEKKLIAYKGFDKDLKCKGFQYNVGETYEHDGPVKACESGFHACERPLDVFTYYPPAGSRFCAVEQSGEISRDSSDSKAACSKIKIGAEVGIPGLVKAQIEYVKAHTTTEYTDPEKATAGARGSATAGDSGAATAGYRGVATAGDSGAATAGDSGAATAGYRGAATAGDCGAATAGDCGAATAGYRGAATAGDYGVATAGNSGAATAGYRGAATAGDCGSATAGDSGAATARGAVSVGENSAGLARGNNVKIKGGLGAVLVIVEEFQYDYNISDWKAVVVDGDVIKADTWYCLKNGQLVQVE